MRKTMKKIRLFFLSLLSFLSLSSCASFFSDPGRQIDDIVTRQEENGDTVVTITFTDNFYDPVVFTIPAPEDGTPGPQGPIGNGIEGIEKVTEGGRDYLLITFTDDGMEPARIEIPPTVSIADVTSSYDVETGANTITIALTDGTEHSFVVQDGKDGVGIRDITSTTDEEGNTTIVISYTDESREDTLIQIPYVEGKDGEDGRGIASITSQSANGTYYVYITYTDDPDGENVEVLEFPMPESTKWFSGNGEPSYSVSLQAKEGDFYYDLTNYAIYLFNGYTWSVVANLRNDTISCTVEFDATTNGGILDGSYLSQATCLKGESLDYTQIPTASKEGCTFLGWYTSAQGPNDPRAGRFTDLTPVTKTYLHLFACFEEVQP